MTVKTLYIELFQPFAQYRNPFTFYYAQTYPLPPRSTIIGMLQNALNDWYGHERGVDKWWNLKVSVHGGFESYFWNYQQLIKGETELRKKGEILEIWNKPKDKYFPLYGPLKSQRTPVYQQELFNGRLYIFLRGEDELLDDIEGALRVPKKILYLGRSEDIIYIRAVKQIEKDEIKKKTAKRDIWMTCPTYIMKKCNGKEFPIKNKRYPVYSIPVEVRFKNGNKDIKNKAEITRKTERVPKFCTVIHSSYGSMIRIHEEVKVEKIKINEKIFKIPEEWGWLHGDC